MCTVLLRFRPGTATPVLLGAIRDEFMARPWDPPARHWDGPRAHLVGGRDRTAGGTWLAVDPTPGRPQVAALLNGPRRPALEGGVRPTRGTLALDALALGWEPTTAEIVDHDGFHLLVADRSSVRVWSWDGERLDEQVLDPGDHIVVNLGVDTTEDPLVPHFAPLLAATADPLLTAPSAAEAWDPWDELLAGDRLDPEDPRALLVRRLVEDRTYGSTSATLVALTSDGVRYDFNPDPWDPTAWHEVPTP